MKLFQFFKIISFFVLFLLLSAILTTVFMPKWLDGNTPMTKTTLGFYQAEENSIDVLYVGSSQILRGISPLTIWAEQGIAGYTRATTVQPSEVPLYYVKEALKSQEIELVVIDFSTLYNEYDTDEREPYLRYTFDYMPLDFNKVQTVSDVLESSDEQTVISYIYPLLRYHFRWSELNEDDFTWIFDTNFADPNKGAVLLNDSTPQEEDTTLMEPSVEVAEYNVEAYEEFIDFVEYCRENSIDVLFLRMPRTDWTYAKHNADQLLADTSGIQYIDTNLPTLFDEIGLNLTTDFYDYDHLNTKGALKFSSWLGNYMKTNYDLTYTRDDKAYDSWLECYDLFESNMGL